MKGSHVSVDPEHALAALYPLRDRLIGRADSGDEQAAVILRAVELTIMDYADEKARLAALPGHRRIPFV